MKMRAKMTVREIIPHGTNCEEIKMAPVCGGKPFGPNGESEDNTFARYSPSGSLALTITNPNLVGTFKVDQAYYVDFTEADVPAQAQ